MNSIPQDVLEDFVKNTLSIKDLETVMLVAVDKNGRQTQKSLSKCSRYLLVGYLHSYINSILNGIEESKIIPNIREV